MKKTCIYFKEIDKDLYYCKFKQSTHNWCDCRSMCLDCEYYESNKVKEMEIYEKFK